MTKDEALKLALEAITTYLSESPDASEEAVEGLWDAINVARKALAQTAQYRQANPLGGPAKVFDAMAAAIRAGDKYESVLRQFGYQLAQPEQEPVAACLEIIMELADKYADAMERGPFSRSYQNNIQDARANLQAAVNRMAQPEQEPVGKFAKFTDGIWREVTDGSAGVPLYTAPPQRPWVGLTDEEIWTVLQFRVYNTDTIDIAKAIEAKLRSKNT
jgi:hypothetical protein